MLTHMRQPASYHITLESVGTASGTDFQRICPDATNECKYSGCDKSGCFRVPVGKVLVVTDVDWQYHGKANGVQTFRVFIENLADPHMRRRVFESTITLNCEGYGGISESMTSGFVVSSKGKIAVDTFPGGGKIQHVILRGYLAPDI